MSDQLNGQYGNLANDTCHEDIDDKPRSTSKQHHLEIEMNDSDDNISPSIRNTFQSHVNPSLVIFESQRSAKRWGYTIIVGSFLMVIASILLILVDLMQLYKWQSNVHQSFKDPRPALVNDVWEEPRTVYIDLDIITYVFLQGVSLFVCVLTLG